MGQPGRVNDGCCRERLKLVSVSYKKPFRELYVFFVRDWITSSADPNCLYHTTGIQLSHNLRTKKLCLWAKLGFYWKNLRASNCGRLTGISKWRVGATPLWVFIHFLFSCFFLQLGFPSVLPGNFKNYWNWGTSIPDLFRWESLPREPNCILSYFITSYQKLIFWSYLIKEYFESDGALIDAFMKSTIQLNNLRKRKNNYTKETRGYDHQR